jgi:23S rRNA pseudouridine1911/1915/1917 synthase
MLTVIYEDKEMIVCEKPAGIPSQGDKTGDRDMLSLIQESVAEKTGLEKPYIAPVHRLDRTVGGIMVFAKTRESAAAFSKAIQDGDFHKTYFAVVNGRANQGGELIDFLLKNQRLNMSKVVPGNMPNAKQAVLKYKTVDFFQTEASETLSLLEIQLLTGRHHQIRVQLAHAGLPVWGDTKYNPNFIRKPGFHSIALWAYRLKLNHPISRKEMTFQAVPHEKYPFTEFVIK